MKRLLPIMLLFPSMAMAQLWSGVISTGRATDWTQAGIPGGIPNWGPCAGGTIAPYGSGAAPGSPSTINNALAANGGTASTSGNSCAVVLGAGDFYLNDSIIGRALNHVELRGQGAGSTRLHFTSASNCSGGNCQIGFVGSTGNYPGGPGVVVNWTAGYAQGATSITVDNGSTTSVGTVIILDQCDTGYTGSPCNGPNGTDSGASGQSSAIDNGNLFECEDHYHPANPPSKTYTDGCSYTGSIGALAQRPERTEIEQHIVTGCTPSCGGSGTTTLTITPGLVHQNWASSQTPQLWTWAKDSYVGISNLAISGASFSYGSLTWGIEITGYAYPWVRGVSLDSFANQSLGTYLGNFAAQIESNYVYNSGQGPSNDSSGYNLVGGFNKIVNNICQKGLICFIGNGPSAGSVYGYNFAVLGNTGNGYVQEHFRHHSGGFDYNLYEGNIANGFLFDQAHGTALVNTFYRNFFRGWEPCGNGQCGTGTTQKDSQITPFDGPISNHRYENAVANVLGTQTIHTQAYQILNSSSWNFSNFSTFTGVIYNIGAGNINQPPQYGGPIPADNVVSQTFYRWGNCDAFNGFTNCQWNTGEVPTSPPGGVLAQTVPTGSSPGNCTSAASCPASFIYTSRPSWWPSSTPFPLIGPDVTSGNVGACGGTLNATGQYYQVAATSFTQCAGQGLNTAWGGHINANPAMACALKLGMPPDGTGPILAFDAGTCYASLTPTSPTISGNIVVNGNVGRN